MDSRTRVPTARWRARLLSGATVATAALVLGAGSAQAQTWQDQQWYLDTFDIEQIHALTRGEGVTIGLIDTGTDITQADLVGADITPVTGYGSISDPFQDPKAHGTSMAALLVGQGVDGGVLGMAPDASLLVSSVNWNDDQTGEVEGWQAEAIVEMVDQGVDIISTSIGGGSGAQEQMRDALEYAMERDVPVVVSAGNNEIHVVPGCDPQVSECWSDQPTEDTTLVSDGLHSPGTYPYAIPVFAHDVDGERWEKSPDADFLDLPISAPGEDLVAAMPGGEYSIQSGTSGAAPLVAGTFALAVALHPEATWQQLVDLVFTTLVDAGEPGKDEAFGWGILDPLAALTAPLPALQEDEPTAPPTTADSTADEYPVYPESNEPPLWVQHTITLTVLALVVTGIVLLVARRRRRRRRRLAEQSPVPQSVPWGG